MSDFEPGSAVGEMSLQSQAEPGTSALLGLLRERVTGLWAARRTRGVADVTLRGLVITESEVDALLAEHDEAGEPQFQLGSLWMQARLQESSEILARLATVQERFRLSAFEIECVIACLAPDVDRRFERIYAYLNDSVALRYPTADLLLSLLAPAAQRPKLRSLFAPDARLIRYGILNATAETGSGTPSLQVADGICRFLLDQGGIDALLARSWCSARHLPLAQSLWQQSELSEQLSTLIREHREDPVTRRTPLMMVLEGRPGSGRRYSVEAACGQLGCGCLALDARLLKRHGDLARTLTAAFRDSMLSGAPLLLHQLDVWFDDAERWEELRLLLERLLDELGWAIFVTTQDAAALARLSNRARIAEFSIPESSISARVDAWARLLQMCGSLAPEETTAIAESLGAKYRLNDGEMAEAMFRALSARQVPSTADQWRNVLPRHAAAVAAPRLKALAQQVHSHFRFDDLVLVADKKELLTDIVCRLRHRRRVMDEWGFEQLSPRGRGLVALFYGPSGTGKTMAAEVIAGELGMDLYRIDLAGVVSKYIGETEKNLRAIFDEADRSDALLFFDEADALFGKRSEVRDAHDRYANIEINYLLQRIEIFSGIAILATNMRQQLDEAFMRRIHVSVEFCTPRAPERLAIWQRSFPTSAPLASDADLSFFAKRFEISGGTIRNIALGAAFLAADQNSQIGMPQLIAAAQREFVKVGRRVLPGDFSAPLRANGGSAVPPKSNGSTQGAHHGLSPA